MREPEPPLRDDDFDQRFAEIVAQFNRTESDADPTFTDAAPDATDPAPRPTGRSSSGINPPIPPRPPVVEPPALNIPVWRGAGSVPLDEVLKAEEEADHYVPPPPAPLPPQEDLHFWGIILGLVGGPLLLLWLILFRPDVSDWWTALALTLCIGGFVLLVLRGPRNPDERPPGDGAVL